MHRSLGLGVATMIVFVSLCSAGVGCKWFASGQNKAFTDENEFFKCTLDVKGGSGLSARRTVSYDVACEAKKEEITLHDITVTYTVREKQAGKSTYSTRVAAETTPIGEESVTVTPEKPFRHSGSITAGSRLDGGGQRQIHVSARVAYPKGPLSDMKDFDTLQEDIKKNPSKYNMKVSKNL